jgi:hypothetical protein
MKRLVPTAVIARSVATKQSILSAELWIASRSLSSGAHSRDPLARNDGESRHLHGFESLTSNLPIAPEMTKSL